MPKCDKYHAKWKANMAKCSKYHAKCKVTMPKCSKYHAKWQVLVPNCCKYKANGARKESQKQIPKPEAKEYPQLFYTLSKCGGLWGVFAVTQEQVSRLRMWTPTASSTESRCGSRWWDRWQLVPWCSFQAEGSERTQWTS